MKRWRLVINIGMTAVLLCLMPYSRLGDTNHEILGVVMFALFAAHHILNRRWLGALQKGRYGAFRIVQTVLVAALVLSVLASIASGFIVSNHVFYPLTSGVPYEVYDFAKGVHMVAAHLNYVLMSLHLGLHWSSVIAAVRKDKEEISVTGQRVMWGLAVACAAYGVYAFIARHFWDYITLRAHFLMLGDNESLVFFYIDYLAIMGLFVFIGYCAAKLLKKPAKQTTDEAGLRA